MLFLEIQTRIISNKFLTLLVALLGLCPCLSRAEKKISFGFKTEFSSAKVSEAFVLYSFEAALQNPTEVVAVSVSGNDKNLPEIKKLTHLKYLYLDPSFSTNSFYLTSEGIGIFFNALKELNTVEFISICDYGLLDKVIQSTSGKLKGITLNTVCNQLFERNATFWNSIEYLSIKDPAITSLKLPYSNSIRQFEINAANLARLDESMCQLVSLEVLKIQTGKITSMPVSFINLSNLKYLSISGTENFKLFPTQLFDATSLEELHVDLQYVKFIPEEISKLKKLRRLYLNGAIRLKELPKGLATINTLEELYIGSWDTPYNIDAISDISHPFLLILNVCDYSKIINLIPDYKNLTACVVPTSILPKELKKIKNLLGENKVRVMEFDTSLL